MGNRRPPDQERLNGRRPQGNTKRRGVTSLDAASVPKVRPRLVRLAAGTVPVAAVAVPVVVVAVAVPAVAVVVAVVPVVLTNH